MAPAAAFSAAITPTLPTPCLLSGRCASPDVALDPSLKLRRIHCLSWGPFAYHLQCSAKLSSSRSTLGILDASGSAPTLDGNFPLQDVLSCGGLAVLEDIADRPEVYADCLLALFATIVSISVMSATLAAVDAVPLLPGILRLIGLFYVFWFLSKHVFSLSARTSVRDNVASFVSMLAHDKDVA